MVAPPTLVIVGVVGKTVSMVKLHEMVALLTFPAESVAVNVKE